MPEEKKYKKLHDVLPQGKHRVRVYPKNEWDSEKKEWIKGTHKSGVAKSGNTYWLYSTKVGDDYIGMIAFDEEEKRIHDTGEVEVNVVQKIDKATKEPMYKAAGEPILMSFINEIKTSATPITDVVEKGFVEKLKEEEKVNIQHLPF